MTSLSISQKHNSPKMHRKIAILALSLTIVFGCGQGNKTSTTLSNRDFPILKLPVSITDPQDQLLYAAEHFWDSFTDSSALWLCDSLHINGCASEQVEAQMANYTSLLLRIPLKDARDFISTFFKKLESFQEKYPESNLFSSLTELVSRYLYDVNSPLRNEDIYLPFVEKLSTSPFSPEELHPAYAHDARMCALNQEGTKAAEIEFTDTKGRRRKLSDVEADVVLLFFNNPGCHACRDIRESIQEDELMQALVGDGHLAVVTIYIDLEIDKWKAASDEYPSNWICGYDHAYKIRSDIDYNVRAIPSLYLLDGDMTVLMKDAPIERVAAALYSMAGVY